MFMQGLRPTRSFLALLFRFQLSLQPSQRRKRRLHFFVFAGAAGVLRRTAVRAEPRTIFITEGLEGHRERDHLSEEIVEADHGPSIRAHLEVIPEADSIFRESLFPFWIRGPPPERFEDQPVGFAKRMRIALAASAALEADRALEIALDHHVFRNPGGVHREPKRRLDPHGVVFAVLGARRPPFRGHLEVEALGAVGEPLDLNAKVGHGGGPLGSENEEKAGNSGIWAGPARTTVARAAE